jgi:hypothetical protein
MDYALSLGHANFDGNLIAETVNDGTATVPVTMVNDWKLGENINANTDPDYPEMTAC